MDNFTKNQPFPAFALGTGRCGTRFIAELMDHSREVLAFHEQAPLSDTFLRYVTWYQLAIDVEGCWAQKVGIVKKTAASGKKYFESSAYLSLNVEELYHRFDSRFIFLVRHPKAVVNSYFAKGWYKTPVIRENPELPPAMQPGLKQAHHHFGRIVAYGEEGKEWQQLTRIGKLSWYWQLINSRIIAGLDQLPTSQYLILRLEDFTFEKYLEICHLIAIRPSLSERKFSKIAARKPNKRQKSKEFPIWSDKALEEYQHYVTPLAHQLGYDV